MVKSCVAVNCTRRWKKEEKIKFHKFPKDPYLRKLWVIATKRVNYVPGNEAVLCENHFQQDDYETNVHGNRVLKVGSIPSFFNFPDYTTQAIKKRRTMKRTPINQKGVSPKEPITDMDSPQEEASSGNEATPDGTISKSGDGGNKMDIDNVCIGCLEIKDLDEMKDYEVGGNNIILIYEELTKIKLDTTKVRATMCSDCILELSKAYQLIESIQLSYMLLEKAAQRIDDLQIIKILDPDIYDDKKMQIMQDMVKEKSSFTERMNLGKLRTKTFTKNKQSRSQAKKAVVSYVSDDDIADNISDQNDSSSSDEISLAKKFNIKVAAPKSKKVKEISKSTPSRKKDQKETRKKQQTSTKKDTVHVKTRGEKARLKQAEIENVKIEWKEEFPDDHYEVVVKTEEPEREDEDVESEENTEPLPKKRKRHPKSKSFKLECNKCDNTKFKSYMEAEEHFKLAHKSEITCILCGEEYFSSYYVLFHMMQQHGKQKCCKSCLLSFKDSEELNKHYQSEEHNRKCRECGKEFKHRKALNEHRRRAHHNAQLKKQGHKCPVCGKEFVNQYNIKRHIQVTHNDMRFLCDTCGQSYTTRSNLRLHILKFHEGVQVETRKNPFIPKNFFCETCGKDLKIFKRYSIAVHIAKHKGHNYICKKCYESFESKEQFQDHVEELGHQLYECEKCQAQFVREDNYKLHLRSHDPSSWNENIPGRKPPRLQNENGEFICNYCQKPCKDRHRLANHLRVHTNERPYQCHICGKSFKAWIHRKTHLDIHLGIKKWVCKYCAKAFTHSCTLKGHERIHTGERPYRCPECDKGFITMSAMKKHRTVHYRSDASTNEKKANRITKVEEEKSESENENEAQIEYIYEYGESSGSDVEVPYESLVEQHLKASS